MNGGLKAACAIVAVAAVGLVALSMDTSCANPAQLCRGTSINRYFLDAPTNTQLAPKCTECVEATCCDLIGDCQTTDCANQVASAHACVVDAGRRASVSESSCRRTLANDESRTVYQCMRDNCDDECGLPTCRLDPLVPRLGDESCDLCFAQGCCSLMNQCGKNRACLQALQCIVDKCSDQLGDELAEGRAKEAEERMKGVCDAGIKDDGQPHADCFVNCILGATRDNDQQSFEAQCLSVQISHCGAAVNCGKDCRLGRDDASAPSDAAAEAGPSDAGADAPSDAPAD